MCNFKSGIILRGNKILIEEGEDHHSEILHKHKIIDDTTDHDRKKFCRFEYVPRGKLYEYDKYELVIDESVVPSWLTQRHKNKAIKEADKYIREHVLYKQEIDEIIDKKDLFLFDCKLGALRGSSQVKYMNGSSQVTNMYGSSQVKYMYDSSQVKYMNDSSQVTNMYGSSQVTNMYDSSQVKYMYDSSQAVKNGVLYLSKDSDLKFKRRRSAG